MLAFHNAYNLVYLYSVYWLKLLVMGSERVPSGLVMDMSTSFFMIFLSLFLLLLQLLFIQLLLVLFLIVYLLKARKSGLGGAATFAFNEVDPDKVSTLCLTDLF